MFALPPKSAEKMRKKQRLTSDDLRQLFLEFFREKDHPILPGSPLAPHDDPTLLFNTAGMVQFKPYYVARGSIPYRRAATVQPCLRASDLENVGITARHHTFFEMLGNFSFGDYFKEEAIEWAWEFSIDRLGLDPGKIWISVYEDDDEAAEIWEKKIGIPAERIVRLGAKDNFWGPAGGSGPCGPCSELHIDRGEEYGCDRPDCAVGCDCDRYLEYWNLVFPQFDQTADGERLPLANRGIDTGMGLERLTQIVQDVRTNYETDLFVPIMESIRSYVKDVDSTKGDALSAVKVIADHMRALVFAINEGVIPGNDGRGYVLRRILRRAVLRANRLGIEELFLDSVAGAVIDRMKGAYPELEKNRELIQTKVRVEEESFRRTLDQGLENFARVIESCDKRSEKIIPGEDAFRLYDTYGFPIESTVELAEARGYDVDLKRFEEAMEEQRKRSRWTVEKDESAQIDLEGIESDFIGYEKDRVHTGIVAIIREGGRCEGLEAGEEGSLVLAQSPFYGESGGQVGDTGHLESDSGETLFHVDDTRRSAGDHPLLIGKANTRLAVGTDVVAVVDDKRRQRIRRNHTATHLAHQALREVLGDHVQQAGSHVAPDRFRFDFVHHTQATREELRAVERIVNRKVIADIPLDIKQTSYADAQKMGAMALFGEKYGEVVRMVSIGEYSRELCGGTHVGRTGEIGPFLVVSESAVGSGIRRIEGITGVDALSRIEADRDSIAAIAERLRTVPGEAVGRIEAMQEKMHLLEKDLVRARQSAAGNVAGDLLAGAELVDNIRVIAARIDEDPGTLKGLIDTFRKEKEPVVAVLGAKAGEEKAFLVAGVSDALVERGIKAGDLAGLVAGLIGGRGGGKPTFAQAGGKNPEKLEEALRAVPDMIRKILSGG